jgi:hypothetical protein
MRLPRMTTRRWMIAVAVVGLSFWIWRYGVALKRERDRHLALAKWHATAEADYHRKIATIATTPTRAAIRAQADKASLPSPTSTGLGLAVERYFRLPAEQSTESEGGNRFREAQARYYALADKRRQIMDEHERRQSERFRKLADHHAELVRIHLAAARYPWLLVEPDPPEP